MENFLWFIIALFSVSCIGKIIFFVTGEYPDRSKFIEYCDFAIYIFGIIWALLLLFNGLT